MQFVNLQEPVDNPRTEVNVMEIYYDLFNVSWSTDRPAIANAKY